jgi:hypothetical protein
MKLMLLLLATSTVHATSASKAMTYDAVHEIPEIGKTREIDPGATGIKAYKKSKFEPCGAEQQSWGAVNGKRLMQALVIKTANGFAPAALGDPSASCEVLVTDENDDVLGNLRPLGFVKKIGTYSIIPGEMIGIPNAMFFLAPNFDPKKPPQFLPATCSLQDAKPQIVLTAAAEKFTKLVSLVTTKPKPEPLPVSDEGGA